MTRTTQRTCRRPASYKNPTAAGFQTKHTDINLEHHGTLYTLLAAVVVHSTWPGRAPGRGVLNGPAEVGALPRPPPQRPPRFCSARACLEACFSCWLLSCFEAAFWAIDIGRRSIRQEYGDVVRLHARTPGLSGRVYSMLHVH